MNKRKWDRLSEEERELIKQDLIMFFERERDEKIGVIAAGDILDFFLQSAGSTLYNKGIVAARASMTKRHEELGYDLDDLMDI